jgi:hypothetical protein
MDPWVHPLETAPVTIASSQPYVQVLDSKCEQPRRGDMRDTKRLLGTAFVISLFLCLAGVAAAQAQGRMTILATARGTSTQMGKMYDVTIIIENFSTPDDRKALIDAFKRSGQSGLVNVLEDMKPKGRVRFSSGGVGNDVKYIMELPSPNGRRLRLVTDRNLAFGELYHGTRSRDYSVGALELVLAPDGKESSGKVLPACRLTVDKNTQQIEIETYQNPWNLTNITIHND